MHLGKLQCWGDAVPQSPEHLDVVETTSMEQLCDFLHDIVWYI